MPDQKRFNVDDSEVKRCRTRIVEIERDILLIGTIHHNVNLDQAPISEVERLIALTTELATIRGIQQEHALRCAAEMQVSLNERARR